ncbi:MAG: hypothetical protein C0407_12880 [Desulfobacca sp.]|nr:hypothetical protein [Desulfobacca sp.]
MILKFIFMSRLRVDRLFGHLMVALSKARRFGFRPIGLCRSFGETPGGSRTGSLLGSSAYGIRMDAFF